MIVLFHRGGTEAVPACHGPAFGIKHDMRTPAANMPADNVLKLDGTAPQRGEPMFCGTCRGPMFPWMADR